MNHTFIRRVIRRQVVNGKLAVGRARSFSSTLPALFLGVFLFSGCVLVAQETVSKTRDGLVIQLGQAKIELAATASDALRLSVFTDKQAQPIRSSFLVSSENAKPVAWSACKEGDFVGIQTKAGKLLMNPRDGAWTLQSSDGGTLIPKHAIGKLLQDDSAASPQIDIQLGWNQQIPIEVYGCGNGVANLQQTEANAGVANGRAIIPYYWSRAGYAALAVTADDNHPASWHGAANGDDVTWTFPGSQADLYLMPAATLKDAAGAYARLTGAAPVPPLWAFGYLQSRWGWTNRADVEAALKHFQELQIPVDAFIFDFEWYAQKPDYELADKGEPGFADFGWNTNLFPDLVQEIKLFAAQNVRFVGIRKPRLGNDDFLKMVRSKGWDLRSHCSNNVPARDLNFADPNLREWYVQQSENLLRDGVAGWWNDEGEATYTTYYYWNLAERVAMNRYQTNARLWTLNRAYSPGTQRFGAAVWTGDIVSKWDVLAGTPASLLNWGLAGMPYSACDIGGFFGSPSPELMSRWMEAGVFFPIMRTHSEVHYQPHFPWLYGTNALKAMRKAIDLRYRLIPYYYSLAHETFKTGIPWMRPLVMEFPRDPQLANLTDEWLMGKSLLAAPLLHEGGKRLVYLPADDWYAFGTNRMLKGGRTIEVTAALDEIPAYVRAGTILPLGPVIQHTSELPGGPLEVQIYPGKDATFTLVEDDGQTQNYLKGRTRRTIFTWDDARQQLHWKREGNYSGKNVFKEIHVVVFGSQESSEAACPLTSSGTIKPKSQMAANVASPDANSSTRSL